ncbi:actin filament-binding, partial [Fusarium albosuccineum]
MGQSRLKDVTTPSGEAVASPALEPLPVDKMTVFDVKDPVTEGIAQAIMCAMLHFFYNYPLKAIKDDPSTPTSSLTTTPSYTLTRLQLYQILDRRHMTTIQASVVMVNSMFALGIAVDKKLSILNRPNKEQDKYKPLSLSDKHCRKYTADHSIRHAPQGSFLHSVSSICLSKLDRPG